MQQENHNSVQPTPDAPTLLQQPTEDSEQQGDGADQLPSIKWKKLAVAELKKVNGQVTLDTCFVNCKFLLGIFTHI